MDERQPKAPGPDLGVDFQALVEGAMDRHRSPPVLVGEPPEDLKERINNLLFVTMPGPTTINEMEDMATDIHQNIMQAWLYAQAQEGDS